MVRLRGWAFAAVAVALIVQGMVATAAPAATLGAEPRGPAASAAVAPAKELAPMAAAGVRARETGKRVEVSAFRTETSEIYVNPDGTKTMDQHPLPVRVRTGEGWVAPDPSLRKGIDGSYRPVAAITPIVLSGGGGKHLLTFGEPGKRVDLGWVGKLPAPVVTGSRAVYPEVFPGVDLRIDVGVNDFTHLLIVKNRQAALNPALKTLRYPVSSDGLKLSVRPDGSTLATKNGKTVFSAPPPTMWDADGKPERLGIQLASKTMTLTPNAGMLTDPKTKFPVAIDPSLDGRLVNWAHVNPNMDGLNAWTYDRNDEGAKVGRAYGSIANLYRSMFLLNTTSGAQTIAGSQIVSATFRITLNKTPSSTVTPVQLWRLTDIQTNQFINWDNSVPGFWLENLAEVKGEAYPWTEDNPMEFIGGPGTLLHRVVQDVANARRPTVTLGLRAPNETTSAVAQNQWKKFHPNTAVLSVTYNTAPLMPKNLNFTRSRPCGTAADPTAIATLKPQFSAIANDPDAGDAVTTTLQILNQAGTVVHTIDVGPTVTGAAFAWPETPAGKLAVNTLYRYRAFTRDPQTTGPATPDCYFTIDSVKPSIPRIQSSDYPHGEPTLLTQRAGTVTFLPGTTTETDVTEYAYGFDQDDLSLSVKVKADGTATIPVTLPQDDPSKTLYVKAVDEAGNVSATRPPWSLQAIERTPEDPVVPKTRGDANGDGKADVTAVFDHGYGRTAIWNVTSDDGNAFHSGYIGWDSGEAGGFALYRTKPVQGDFDGDGRTELAMFREGAGRQVWLYPLVSDGNRYDMFPHVWTSPPNSWPLSTARVIAGDVDGDGKDDIVVQNAGTGDNWSALVFRASDGFRTPVTWTTAAVGNPWSRSAPLLADVDGDGKDDLLSMRNQTDCRTTVDLYKSTGTGFAAATTIYDSGAGAFCWEKSRTAVTDADGDGKDDVVALYEHAANDAGLFVFRSSGTALSASSWWRRTGELDLAKASLSAGDYDGDGKGDAAIVYAGGASGDRQVYTFHSSGAAFGDKVLGWGGPVGAVTGPKFDIEQRTYELVNRNSGKCLNVQGASTANDARYVQYQCLPVDLNARFHVEQVAGSDQYALKPVHTATAAGPLKCADVEDWSMVDGGQLLQWPCGNGNGDPTANQQFLLEYVDGAAYDTVIHLKAAHSGKCLSILNGTVADLDPVKQETCGQGANQQWILRPAFNATQLGEGGAGRYRVEAATSTARVLDITNCQTADGSDVRMWAWVTGSPCQRWKLESIGDDVYKIVDPNSSKVIDIDGCSKLPGGTIHTWTSNESECQRWRIEPSPGGSFSVLQLGSGLSLDVAGCSSAQGANVDTWFYHGGACQRWFFKRQ
ncbi:RICIN domain-containing protein [Tenggerimyces flavus]|uniref:RICIN domain-containing protein n=1 Tax=Tenggerimyces flavus TaxID=1708749 RepID=A0ABV7Y4A2_9ACTN|nr:RICIN domain-containing protein [Tenggerimyces flavus]MBM7788339.1 hypothetical protein [Tenggerimyces flavus]